SNRLRGLLAEFGVVVARSDHALRRALGDDAVRARLPAMLHGLLDDLHQHWQAVRERMAACDATIAAHARADVRSRRAQQITGVGPLTADALVATIGDGREFAQGRQFSAWLGLTPVQHSSGGRQRLGQISCRGDSYLRTLLIQGARSSLQRAKAIAADRASPEQIWIRDLASRLPFGKVLVAIANKHARQLWAMLARDEDYDADAWLRHPMVQRPASGRRKCADAGADSTSTQRSTPERTGSKRSDRPGESLTNKVAPPHDTADPRAWANPMNERGLRVRFLPWSGSAPPIQQDRLRKCGLATLRSPSLWRVASSKATNRQQQMPEAQGKSIMHSGLTGSSLRHC